MSCPLVSRFLGCSPVVGQRISRKSRIGRGFQEGSDEFRGYLRDDGIAVTPQSSHSGGYPMSQRECAGLNWPPLGIAASEPISILPEDVKRAGPFASHATRPRRQ